MNIRQKLSGIWLGFKIKRGWAPRGRTAPGPMETKGEVTLKGNLSMRHIRGDEVIEERDLGDRVVTNAGVAFLVDAFQNIVEIEAFKYHDSGTGVVAENATDTALGTPTGVARVVGSQIEGASANIYKTVATITYDDVYAVTEHGIFSAAAAGTLWDRTVFAAINVVASDKIEFSYELTCTAGG